MRHSPTPALLLVAALLVAAGPAGAHASRPGRDTAEPKAANAPWPMPSSSRLTAAPITLLAPWDKLGASGAAPPVHESGYFKVCERAGAGEGAG